MTYNELKKMNRDDAIKKIAPYIEKMTVEEDNRFPFFPDVIIFGGYWRTNELLTEFIEEYVSPKEEKNISSFIQEIAYRIISDPRLINNETLKKVRVDYSVIFDQYNKLSRRAPNTLIDFSESQATFIWFEYILPKRRVLQFVKIKKELDTVKFKHISEKIKEIYNFTDLEIIYLHYFCSQSKLDDLDGSYNTCLYLWSKEKRTGKSTVSDYICSFLNGEVEKNSEPHKSELAVEMQISSRFDKPVAINSRCTMLDEAAFHDMAKTYNKFKSMITSNSCTVEYKFKNSRINRRCYRNYIITTNDSPIYFIKDDSERRVLPINFQKPKQYPFSFLQNLWYEFVLECNLPVSRLEDIYNEIIQPNAQAGERKYIMLEIKDLLTQDRIKNLGNERYFSISNIMSLSEIRDQRISRELIKDVLIEMYGEPDAHQRFYKKNRLDFIPDGEDLPF